jgi:hypothetical protein
VRLFRRLDFCCSFFVIVLVLFFGSLLLRASIAIANRWQGTSSKTKKNYDEDDLDEWIGYRKFTEPNTTQGIPEPGILKGMLAILLLSLAGFLEGIVIWLVFFDASGFHGRSQNELTRLAAHAIGLVVGFPLSAWFLGKTLPTRFGSACLVLLANYVLLLLIAVLLISCMSGLV